jgi:hypothetical protein
MAGSLRGDHIHAGRVCRIRLLYLQTLQGTVYTFCV